MKRKNGKSPKRRKVHRRKRSQNTPVKQGIRKHRPIKRKKPVPLNKAIDPRVAQGLGAMRREGISASEASKRERMKLRTFRKGAGRFLYRSGPGKPWKARSEDQLRFSMTVLMRKGRVDVIVRNSRSKENRW